MTLSTDPEAGPAYARASVERYLHAASAEQARLESAIVDVRARLKAAKLAEEHLKSLDLGSEDQIRPDVSAVASCQIPSEVDTADHALAATGSSDRSRL